ncbi:DUF5979 domain-containing protein [Salana multivorans]|uniref:DUF5979 domain-containing protein n=1 Tax=Salana multivorans TaxID=120377 RepID=UPI0024903775|nr:DUF5979 domain-containing protein [Salana multivorans]
MSHSSLAADPADPGAVAPRRRAVVAVLLTLALALALAMMVVGPLAPVAQAAPDGCVGGVISADDVEVTYTTSSGGSTVTAWETFQFDVALTDLDGMAEGCQAVVALDPTRFDGLQDVTRYLNADGSASETRRADTVAVMVVDRDARTLTFTLTDYAETHADVTANGWVRAQINSSFDRGEQVPIRVTVNGTTVPQPPVTGQECPDVCGQPDTGASKWGGDYGDGTGSVTIGTPVLEVERYADLVIEDVLVSPNQSIVGVADVFAYNCVNTWGEPGTLPAGGGECQTGQYIPATATPVDGAEHAWRVTTQGDPAEIGSVFFLLRLDMTFTGDGPWEDRATITSSFPEESWETGVEVTKFAVGGGASGSERGTFSVTKAIDWNGADAYPVGDFSGTWSATLPDNSTRSGAWTVAAGQTWTSEALPTGSVVTLAEEANTNLWTPTWDRSTLTIEGGGNVAATVTNTLRVGWFEVKKVVDWSGVTPWDITFTGTWVAELDGTSIASGTWSVDAENGWRWVSPTKLPAGARVTLSEDATPGWTSSWNDEQVIYVPQGRRTCPEVTNTLQLGRFSIAKQVEWNGLDPAETGAFTGTWRATVGEDVVGSGDWSAEAGSTWTSPDLPVGSVVTYTEDQATGWTAAWSADSVTVAPGEPVVATLTNSRDAGRFSVTKKIDWKGQQQLRASTYAGTWVATLGGERIASGQWSAEADGTWTSPMLPAGAEVVLTENESRTWTPVWTSDRVTIVNGRTAASTVTNDLNLGQFSITKAVEWNDVATYDVGPFTGTWTAVLPDDSTQEGTWRAADGETWSSPVLPAGSTVTYTEDAPADQPAVGWTNAWSSEDVTIATGEVVPVTVTNSAELLTAPFSASKVIEGSGRALVPATATFTLAYRYPAGVGYAAGEGTLVLPGDGTVVVSGQLPVGARLTLEELAPVAVSGGTWQTPELSAETVTIAGAGEPVSVSVTNTITESPTSTPSTPASTTPASATPRHPDTGAGPVLPVGIAAVVLLTAGGIALVARRRSA